jgi:pimeloyl-ACP methyl ester carboxylesterase
LRCAGADRPTDERSPQVQPASGALAQVERDAGTFFDTDLPALLAWRFGAEDARRVDRPVLLVSGEDSGPWFAAVRALVLSWLPRAEDVVVPGAGHALTVTHPGEVAAAVRSFLRRNPMPA